jgi:drug/metabolite transporter (DMT)-like permease
MAEEVNLKIDYTEQDFVDAADGYRAPRRIPVLTTWLCLSGLVILGALLHLLAVDVCVAVSLGLAFFMFAFQPLITNFLTRKDFQAKRDVKDTLQLTFSDLGVNATSTSIAGKNYWSVFTGAAETDEGILLFYGENSYLIIPRRSFSEPADEAGLRRLLLSKVPNFKFCKRVGPSLARVQKPISALVISGFVLIAACLALSYLVVLITPQPVPPAPEETSPVSLGIQACQPGEWT